MSRQEASGSRRFFSRLSVQIVLLVVPCFAFFWDALTAASSKILAGLDILYIHYYAREFTQESLLRGIIPKWNPYEYCGMPFAGDPNNCVFYPLNKLFLFVPIAKAITLNIVSHTLLAGIGTLLLGRTIGIRRGGSFVAAFSFMLSGFFIDRIVAGHEFIIMASAFLPWIFLCYEKASRKHDIRWAIVGGVLLGLQMLSGSGQITLYTSFFLVVYAVARNLSRNKDERTNSLLKEIAYLIVMGIIGAGFSAIMVFPAVELARNSVRAEATLEFIGRSSFPPNNFLHLLFPHLDIGSVVTGWEFTSYIGILPLALGLAALAAIKRPRVLPFAVVAGCALVLMIGRFNPLFSYMLRVIPPLKFFRVHARAELGLMFSLAMLAGLGWEMCFSDDASESKRVCAGLIAVSTFFLLFASVVLVLFAREAIPIRYSLPFPGPEYGQIIDAGTPVLSLFHPKFLFPLCLILGSFLGSVGLLTKARRYVLIPLLALIVIDPFAVSSGRVRTIDASYVTSGNKITNILTSDKNSGYYRVWLERDLLFPTRAKHFKIFSVDGFSPLALRDFQQYCANLTGDKSSNNPLSVSVNPHMMTDESPPYFGTFLNIKYIGYRSPPSPTPVLLKYPAFLPRAFFVQHYLKGTMDEFLNSRIDPAKTVFLHDDVPELPEQTTAHDPAAKVSIESYRNDEIFLSVEAPADGFVVLSETYYPGWLAEVDGVRTRVLRADYLLRAIPVTAGNHKLHVFYSPLSLLLGKCVTLLTAVVIAGTFVFLRNGSGKTLDCAGADVGNQDCDDGSEDDLTLENQ